MGTITIPSWPICDLSGGLSDRGYSISPFPTINGWAGAGEASVEAIRSGTAQYWATSSTVITGVGIEFGINENTEGISLDSDPVINWNSLPAGLQITTLLLNINPWAIAGRVADPSNFVRAICGTYDSGVVASSIAVANQAIIASFPITAFQLLGIRLNITTGGISNSSSVANRATLALAQIAGTYQLVQFSWTLEDDGTLVTPGTTIIHITSAAGANGPALNFTGISQFDMDYYDSSNVLQTVSIPGGSVSVSANSADLTLPNVIGADEPPIINIRATGDGTQFSGSIDLGQLLTIFFTDGSGIYRLVDGKTNDTLYINDTGSTADVKIPDPFIKTAFIP